ncbi:hypothetical protein MSAN_01924200 [Mycena sanguinolenta]|uniref:Uncharacterized protein n=1 Tax=Mycena sanguinolenta TaxID=230812 RepID=A0A8H6XMH7_9AGAR|nr:hypothetical protein MSAN_01924200 [Mycena sanguinolenta]
MTELSSTPLSDHDLLIPPLPLAMSHQPASETMRTMPTYRRTLSPNELSYFLPSRGFGLNDICNRIVIHAPPSLVSPTRVRIAWAILRLRHSLMACRVEMQPGYYDEAHFALTPPSSPSQALAEASVCVHFFDDITGPELLNAFLNGPRTLSSECLSRLDVLRRGEVSKGVHEFHLSFNFHHMMNDALTMYKTQDVMFELLGGSATPGGPTRTDAELAKVLEHEWMLRWGAHRHAHDAIVPATEVRILGLPQSKFQEAAWKVDNQNIQKRSIGGHVFPRTKSPLFKMRLLEAQFDVSQTKAIMAKCKANRVTMANACFGLFNFAWIRVCAAHPELNAPKDLPMLIRTCPLRSEYNNVVLPAFIPRNADPNKIFWARSRAAQEQMVKHARSPLLLKRAVVSGKVRGERAKAWARIDDVADGTLPPPRASPAAPLVSNAKTNPTPSPSLALLGVTHTGDPTSTIFRPNTYPLIKLVNTVGASRKAPGGMLITTRTFLGKYRLILLWDAPAFAPGVMEEFWRNVVDGVHEYVLEDPSLKGTAQELDCLVNAPANAKAKM